MQIKTYKKNRIKNIILLYRIWMDDIVKHDNSHAHEIKELLNQLIILIEIKERQTSVDAKKLSFHEMTSYINIPNRDDILDNGISKDELWWGTEDYIDFKNSALFEIREFMKHNPQANVQYYLKHLWTELDFDFIYAELEKNRILKLEETMKMYNDMSLTDVSLADVSLADVSLADVILE